MSVRGRVKNQGLLLDYPQQFALEQVAPDMRERFAVEKVDFNYDTETWVSRTFELPAIGDDFVLLAPKDFLTKDEVWISRRDMFDDFPDVVTSLPNDQLRDQLNNYFFRVLPEGAPPPEGGTGGDC